MGILTNLIDAKTKQDKNLLDGATAAFKEIVTNPNVTPEAKEYYQKSYLDLVDSHFDNTNAGGGKGKKGAIGKVFSGLLTGLTGGLNQTLSKENERGQQIRGSLSQTATGSPDNPKPKRLFLTDEEKEALKVKNQDIEAGEKMKLDEMNAKQERARKIQDNDEDYHRELDRGIKDMKLSPLDAAKRADDIINKYREPTATKPSAPKQTEIVGPDGKRFTGFIRMDADGAEQLYKLGSNEPLDPTKYAQAQKAETNPQQQREDAINAFKEKHKIKDRELTAVETQQAIAEQKQAEESPDVKAQRGLTTELARQRLAANKTDSTSGAITDSELRALAKESLLTGQNPAFGLGKSGTRDRYNKIKAELIESTGPGPAAEQRSEYKAGSTTLTDLQKRRGQIVSFESTAGANLDQVAKISPQVGRTGSSLANEYIQFTEGKLTDYPMLARYRTAIQTAANEYAKVVNSATGGGVTTDSARKDAESLLNAAMAKGTINATIQQMKIDMKNRRDGLDKEIADTRRQLSDIGSNGGGTNSDNKPIVQHSPSTGKYRYSTDGGKTWQAGQPPQQQ